MWCGDSVESSKVHTVPWSICLSLKTQNTELFLGDDCFRAEGFLLWTDGGIQDCQAIPWGPLPAPCFSQVQNSLWFWCDEEKSGTVTGETLLTSVGMHWSKEKKCKEERRQWRSPGACCVHTEVLIRDVLVKFSGQFRRTTSHLGKPQLTLCSLQADYPRHGVSSPRCAWHLGSALCMLFVTLCARCSLQALPFWWHLSSSHHSSWKWVHKVSQRHRACVFIES